MYSFWVVWRRLPRVSPWSKQQLRSVPTTPPLLTTDAWYCVKGNNLWITHLQTHTDKYSRFAAGPNDVETLTDSTVNVWVVVVQNAPWTKRYHRLRLKHWLKPLVVACVRSWRVQRHYFALESRAHVCPTLSTKACLVLEIYTFSKEWAELRDLDLPSVLSPHLSLSIM